MNILLADDDWDLLFALERTMRGLGHDVLSTHDGNEAFACYRKAKFDVVVCDLDMPGLDGHDLCRAIRAMCRESYTYIVMLTAAAGPDTCVQALDSGADAFITKASFDRDILAASLRVAERMLRLHAHVTRLEGIIGVCAWCKRFRGDDGQWIGVEEYLKRRTEMQFSHGICPACMTARYPCTPGEKTLA